jgi:hypothetical protein
VLIEAAAGIIEQTQTFSWGDYGMSPMLKKEKTTPMNRK